MLKRRNKGIGHKKYLKNSCFICSDFATYQPIFCIWGAAVAQKRSARAATRRAWQRFPQLGARFYSTELSCHGAGQQGCQIFLGTTDQNIPNDHKLYQSAVKKTKWT
jgi:hypothetical protein